MGSIPVVHAQFLGWILGWNHSTSGSTIADRATNFGVENTR
jgi:hypothetical protein